MMMKLQILVLTGLILCHFPSLGQKEKPCGTSEMEQKLIEKDPRILPEMERLEKFTEHYIHNKSEFTKNNYIIPVVFHVMHYNGPEYLSVDRILQAVENLNQDFSASNNEISNVIPEFQDIIGNATVEFRLAKLDPNGNCTNGILWVQSNQTNGADDNIKYESPAWPRDRYLNIWTVGRIASGYAAYTYLPGSVTYQSAIDGIIIDDDYTGITNTRRHTLSHEVGHWFNLNHPWGGGSTPGLEGNCQTDDNVEDTPNTVGYSSDIGCSDLYLESCGSLDNVQNFMDYSYCYAMFTSGQIDRMHAAMNSSTSGRNNLWTEENLMLTGTSDNYAASPCPEFIAENIIGCENAVINFFDATLVDDVDSWSWTFEGGNPASSTEANPVITYENEGNFDVSFTVSNENGSNTITKENHITITDTYAGYSIPMSEEFEDNAFPINSTDETKNWTIDDRSDETWSFTDAVSVGSGGSVLIKNQLITDETINELISPNINLRGFTPESISFNLAFANRSSSSSGELKVYISKNCGVNWQLVYAKSGNQLETNGGTDVTGSFVPTVDEWRQETISSSTFENEGHIRIKFVNKSLGGNYLYIDDVSVNKIVGIEEVGFDNYINDLKIYPNPFSNFASINYTLTKAQPITFEVFSIIGKKLGQYKTEQNAGFYSINTNEILPAFESGIYTLKITAGNSSTSRRVVKY